MTINAYDAMRFAFTTLNRIVTEVPSDELTSIAADARSELAEMFADEGMPRLVNGRVTKEDIKRWADEQGKIWCIFSVGLGELACISHDGTLDGLNDYVDEFVFDNQFDGSMQDYSYNCYSMDEKYLYIRFSCDASLVLDSDDE